MDLKSQVAALEEEVGMLKGEIKSILQEVRVAILARQNPFLSDGIDRPAGAFSVSAPGMPEAPAAAPMPAFQPVPPPQAVAAAPAPPPAPVPSTEDVTPRLIRLLAEAEDASDQPSKRIAKRPVDLAALMVWVQESAEKFSHTEFVMLVTMASYADFFDEGLKQALVDMSQQILRDQETRATLSDFSLALKQLEPIRTSSQYRHVA